MCTVLLPPDVNPIAVDKYIISFPKFGKGAGELAQKFDKVLYLVHFRALMIGFYLKNPISALYLLTPLYSHCTFLHVSALKGPSSGSTDTFYEQGQQHSVQI